jgi:hypothetical protein
MLYTSIGRLLRVSVLSVMFLNTKHGWKKIGINTEELRRLAAEV